MPENERRGQYNKESSDITQHPINQDKDQPAPGLAPRLPVVGIGASAGGLSALQSFFDVIPTNTGMAFVVVTHMDPDRKSLLPELLQLHTAMTVHQLQEQVAIEPNHIYVPPPNCHILITETHLDVEEFQEPRGRRAPIDHFFRSLAQKHTEASAIILSGGGTDGAVGVKAIKEHGGMLMVQDPNEAEYDSMPLAAINTGLADVVLPVAQLAEKLISYRRNGSAMPHDPEALTMDQLGALYRILSQVRSITGHDFSQYKHTTILRRIQRRMQLQGFSTLDTYLTYLHQNTDEPQALFNDLLIGVTHFFRDQETWQVLTDQIIPRLFENKEQGDKVRVWSIGCATGEEAYSLAILLMEHQSTLEQSSDVHPGIQVFASDLDDAALNSARQGLYPEAIEADVTPERLKRFFTREGDYYQVKRELRDMVLFSNHNVLRDPPFSRLDLISCRNLLIYLQRNLQQNVFQIFHYALKPEHFLFLGNSESAELESELFRTLNKPHHLYQARSWRGDHREVPALPLIVRDPLHRGIAHHSPGGRQKTKSAAAADAADYHIETLEKSAPPSILVDETFHVIHLSETAGRYLQLPRGKVTRNLLKLVRPELKFELSTALIQSTQQNKAVVAWPVPVQFNGTPHPVTIAVRPSLHTHTSTKANKVDSAERMFIVFFLEDEAAEGATPHRPGGDSKPEAEGRSQTHVNQLEEEMQRLREQLQATIEENESTNEEMRAANEELQSINEEYRSTTEELETSKEELQSVNEELQTVNAELKNKLEEISNAHSDMENLLSATDIATLFLNRDLHIQRYTPATTELFNILSGDRGRPISHLTHKLAYDSLTEDAAQVLDNLVPIEREIQDDAGNWLLVRLSPYRTIDHRIDGVVLTFVNITNRKKIEIALRHREQELVSLNEMLEKKVTERTIELQLQKEYSDNIVDTVREGLLALKPDLTVEFANESFYRMFQVNKQETVGRQIYELGSGQWNIPNLRTLLEEILPQQTTFNDFKVEYEFENIGRRVMLLNARRLENTSHILLAIENASHPEQEGGR